MMKCETKIIFLVLIYIISCCFLVNALRNPAGNLVKYGQMKIKQPQTDENIFIRNTQTIENFKYLCK